jgi:hypothetical protein
MRSDFRKALDLLKREGFSVDEIRNTTGDHKVAYTTAANGSKHVFTLQQTYGCPRSLLNLRSLARRRAKEPT